MEDRRLACPDRRGRLSSNDRRNKPRQRWADVFIPLVVALAKQGAEGTVRVDHVRDSFEQRDELARLVESMREARESARRFVAIERRQICVWRRPHLREHRADVRHHHLRPPVRKRSGEESYDFRIARIVVSPHELQWIGLDRRDVECRHECVQPLAQQRAAQRLPHCFTQRTDFKFGFAMAMTTNGDVSTCVVRLSGGGGLIGASITVSLREVFTLLTSIL